MEYQIGDFSTITRLGIKTLRYYHEAGILLPSRIDKGTGYRYYDEKSIEKAYIISELRAMEFTIEEIKDIFKNYNEDETLTCFMKKKLADINQRISKYVDIRTKLIDLIENGEELTMYTNGEIVIKEIPDLLIASIRFRGRYSDVGKYIGTLYKTCGSAANGKPFSLYYQNEFMEENADIEICLPISKEISKDPVKSRILKGGQALSCIHKGEYDSIGKTYKILVDYMNQNNLKPGLPTREIYLKGPGMIFKGNPAKYITEIQVICH